MATYRLKPLPVDVFYWDGVQTTLDAAPAWVISNVLTMAPVPGKPLFCLFITGTVEDPRAMILAPTESLLRTQNGKIYGITAAEFADQVEDVAAADPGPAQPPMTDHGTQPYEPIDHVFINGVENVRYYPSPKGSALRTMPLTDWRTLNPAVTNGLH